jgi:hypothetical protein
MCHGRPTSVGLAVLDVADLALDIADTVAGLTDSQAESRRAQSFLLKNPAHPSQSGNGSGGGSGSRAVGGGA